MAPCRAGAESAAGQALQHPPVAFGRAPAQAERRLGQELQEYMYRNMIYMSATSLPSLQAARDYVQGYIYERGFKVRFETTWLNK